MTYRGCRDRPDPVCLFNYDTLVLVTNYISVSYKTKSDASAACDLEVVSVINKSEIILIIIIIIHQSRPIYPVDNCQCAISDHSIAWHLLHILPGHTAQAMVKGRNDPWPHSGHQRANSSERTNGSANEWRRSA